MVTPNTTASHLYQLQLQHGEGWRIYENMETMDEALKNQVIAAAEDT